MADFTNLNDMNLDGQARSSTQGIFLGYVRTMPKLDELSEADRHYFCGGALLYLGCEPEYLKGAFYEVVCKDGVYSWQMMTLAPQAGLTPYRAVGTDNLGYLVTTEATLDDLDNLSGTRSNVQRQLDGKSPVITGAARDAVKDPFAPNKVVVTNDSGIMAASPIDETALLALAGLRGSIQAQLDLFVPKATEVNGHALDRDIELTAEDVGALPNCTKIPAKTSDLHNDGDGVSPGRFITSSVEYLDNFYRKDETYNRTEVDDRIRTYLGFSYQQVDALPQKGEDGIIYIVPSDVSPDYRDMYIWGLTSDGSDGWVYLGSSKIEAVPMTFEQYPDRIVVNSTDMQFATLDHVGIMTTQQVEMLKLCDADRIVGGSMRFEDGAIKLDLNRFSNSDSDITLEAQIAFPESVIPVLKKVPVKWADIVRISSSSGMTTFEVSEDIDVTIRSHSQRGGYDFLTSVVKVPAGTYVTTDSDMAVFSNAESNTRLGVRVTFTADYAIRVYDFDGIVIEGPSDVFSTTQSSYMLSCLRLGTE